ncbi:MAG: vitamin K epoxide reductase family protein [Patescibacteria group bacterium]|nr:vitamin K epoxide reductase family protein [Patescibacteria group bacterium]MCL5431944.1 vitamin K epoxide reductase family protein [Patescibacteria group bacterium]
MNKLRILILVLALVGVFDAGVLTAQHLVTLNLPCPVGGGCELVLRSKYAAVGPVPLAAFGLVYYLTIFWLALKKQTKLLLGLMVVGVVFSAYLVYLQLFVIHALCQYCLVSAGNCLVLFTAGVLLYWHGNKKSGLFRMG